jgi:hypothetical protein
MFGTLVEKNVFAGCSQTKKEHFPECFLADVQFGLPETQRKN